MKTSNMILSLILFLLPATQVTPTDITVNDVHVSRFGAIPDDGRDDFQALQKAIDQCSSHPGSKLIFDKGVYEIQGTDPEQGVKSLSIARTESLIVNGNGMELLCSGRVAPFILKGCKKVTFENLSIDWKRVPYSVGSIRSVSGTELIVDVEDDFPVDGSERAVAIMEFDPSTRLPKRGGKEIYYDIEQPVLIAPQTLKINLKQQIPFVPGSLAVIRHEVYGMNAFEFHDCAGVMIRNATIFCAPGMGVFADNSQDLALDGLRVLVRPGKRRVLSTTADATHFIDTRGFIRIENSIFEGMGDDAVNVHGFYLRIAEIISRKTVTARHTNGFQAIPRKGDILEFTSAGSVLCYATRSVESASADGPIHRITLSEPIPDETRLGDVLGNASSVPSLEIHNCIVRNNRARGFLIQTRGVLIERNRFEGCTGGGIFITCDSGFWSESIATRDVVVRENQFVGCNMGPGLSEGIISVFAHVKDYLHAALPGVHRNVRIENNQIDGSFNSGIFISASDGVLVTQNQIKNISQMPSCEAGKYPIYIQASRNVTLRNNQILGAEDDSPSYWIGPECPEGAVLAE